MVRMFPGSSSHDLSPMSGRATIISPARLPIYTADVITVSAVLPRRSFGARTVPRASMSPRRILSRSTIAAFLPSFPASNSPYAFFRRPTARPRSRGVFTWSLARAPFPRSMVGRESLTDRLPKFPVICRAIDPSITHRDCGYFHQCGGGVRNWLQCHSDSRFESFLLH